MSKIIFQIYRPAALVSVLFLTPKSYHYIDKLSGYLMMSCTQKEEDWRSEWYTFPPVSGITLYHSLLSGQSCYK